jgi:hypothetical protein
MDDPFSFETCMNTNKYRHLQTETYPPTFCTRYKNSSVPPPSILPWLTDLLTRKSAQNETNKMHICAHLLMVPRSEAPVILPLVQLCLQTMCPSQLCYTPSSQPFSTNTVAPVQMLPDVTRTILAVTPHIPFLINHDLNGKYNSQSQQRVEAAFSSQFTLVRDISVLSSAV